MPAKKRGLATPASSKTSADSAAAAAAAAAASQLSANASPEPAQKRRRSARVQQKQDLDTPIEQSKAGAPPSRAAVTSSSKTPSTSRSADPKPTKQLKSSKKQAKQAVTTTAAIVTPIEPPTAGEAEAPHPSPVTGATAQSDAHVQLAGHSPDDSASISDSPPSAPSGFTPSYWLLKAEPESRIEKGKDVKFSIDDLAACKEPAGWDGVRNYAARNNLRAMTKGDLAFFYHSNCKEPGIVGIMEIAEGASVDETAFNPKEPYFDPKSDQSNPKWYLVKVRFVRKFSRLVGLQELKSHGGPGGELANMPLIKMSRLSVSPVGKAEWDFILSLETKLQ